MSRGGVNVPTRSHKFGAKETRVDGISFPSRREAEVYQRLKPLAEAGEITEFKVGARSRAAIQLALTVNGKHICYYVPDFTYRDADGKLHIVDAKGYKTAVYRLKRHLVKACLGVEIEEV